MVTQVGNQTFGIVVDGVFHTEEIVVKPMSTKLRHIDMFLRQHHPGRWRRDHDHRPQRHRQALGAAGAASHEILRGPTPPLAPAAAEQLTSLLVFAAGSSQPKAVPLGLVTRLEEITHRQDRAL